MNEKLNFKAFSRLLLFSPSQFFRQYLAPEETPRPYWRLVAGCYWFVLLVVMLMELYSKIPKSYVVLLFTLPVAMLVYYYFYMLLTKLQIFIAGGRATWKQVREILFYLSFIGFFWICLFLGLAVALGALAYAVIMLFGIGYIMALPVVGILLLLVGCLAIIPYAIYLQYQAIVIITGAKRNRALFAIFIFPFLWVMLIIAVVISTS